jgi:flagellar biosynthetic protein FliP
MRPISIFAGLFAAAMMLAPVAVWAEPAAAGPSASGTASATSSLLPSGLTDPQEWTSPQGISSALKVMLLLTVVSLAPAILLMTTSFVRILVVMGLLRQALGTQQLPPSQVITSIALFMSALLMTPVWTKVYEDAIKPYSEEQIGLDEAWERGTQPVRKFMAEQIRRTENDDDVHLFLKYLPSEIDPKTGELYDNYVYFDAAAADRLVPLQALLPAFMLSELKTAFLIGFQIYLPFVVLDIVVASVTISMGMLMLPPVLISLPFKLLLFVLVDGWRLVVEMLLQSFQAIS